MREALFLRQNQERWKQYETQATTDPDVLAARFVALTDDLAYAQTFYPQSPTTAYLNSLTGKLHQAIYKNKSERSGRFLQFWKRELPLVVARNQRTLAWAMGVFVLCALLGALSAAYDETFIRAVMGDGYVDMTLENIRHGDPMGVYKQRGEVSMFFEITPHNIRVALLTFAAGLTLGIGTAYLLFQNGLMIGAFQYFCFKQHVLKASLLTIWIHGTLEISSIVLAGGAGFVMARGLLFPGTYSRAEAFRHSAREGLKLAVGLVPLFIIAGFLESFVTRHTEMPVPASLFIIGSSAAFLGWYFIWYPRRLQRELAAGNSPS